MPKSLLASDAAANASLGSTPDGRWGGRFSAAPDALLHNRAERQSSGAQSSNEDTRPMAGRTPTRTARLLRKKLVAARQAMTDRLERSVALQSALRVWLVGRKETLDRRLLADQGRVRSAAGALPLDRRRCRRRDAAHRPARRRPRDQVAALSRLVSGLRDGARRLRHPEAEGHRRVRAADADRALPRLRPGWRAPGLWRRLLRPHPEGS